MHPYCLAVTVRHHHLLPSVTRFSWFLDAFLYRSLVFKRSCFRLRSQPDELIWSWLRSFPAWESVFSAKNFDQHESALSDGRSGCGWDYARISVLFFYCFVTHKWWRDGHLYHQMDVLCLKCRTHTRLALAVCLLPTFLSVFKLNIVCVICQCLRAWGMIVAPRTLY